MAVENDLPESPALLAALAEAIAVQKGRAPLAVPDRLTLARAYASGGLVPPPFATLTAESSFGPAPDGTTMPDLARVLVSMTVARPGAAEARLGLCWLLDPRH